MNSVSAQTAQSVAPPPSDDGFAAADMDLEKTRLLFRNTGMAQTVVVINAGVLVFVLGGLRPPVWAALWWLAATVLAALRYRLALRFRAADPAAADAYLWRVRAVKGSLIAGLLWASGGIALMVADPASTRLFAALVMAGMVAGAIPILSSVPAAYRAYAVPVMLSVILTALLDAHGVRDWMLALVATLYLLALLQSARYFHETLDGSIRLALRMRRMAEQLEQARSDAEAASKAKSKFLALMAHELKTPLAMIDAAIQALDYALQSGNPEVAVRHKRIRAAVGRLNELLETALSVVRDETSGAATLQPRMEPIAIASFVADIAAASGANEVTLHVQPSAVVGCRGDRTLLRLAVGNVVDNAFKYGTPGIAVEFSVLRQSLDGKPGIAFVVASGYDGPAGVDVEAWFGKYHRGPGSERREGIGLGLYLVREIAAAHDGRAFGAIATDAAPACFIVSVWLPENSTGASA